MFSLMVWWIFLHGSVCARLGADLGMKRIVSASRPQVPALSVFLALKRNSDRMLDRLLRWMDTYTTSMGQPGIMSRRGAPGQSSRSYPCGDRVTDIPESRCKYMMTCERPVPLVRMPSFGPQMMGVHPCMTQSAEFLWGCRHEFALQATAMI